MHVKLSIRIPIEQNWFWIWKANKLAAASVLLIL